MKKTLLILAVLAMILIPLAGRSPAQFKGGVSSVMLDSLPNTIDEFKTMAQMDLTKPENTCAMFLCALNLFVKDEDAGIQAMNAIRGPRPMNGHDIQFLRDRLIDKPYLPLAYFEGASPENDYTPCVPYELKVLPDRTESPSGGDYMGLYLKTSGADSPRPVTLRKKGDRWYLWEYSSILLGIRIPKTQDPWA